MTHEYICDKLTHWTGRGRTNKDAFYILSTIIESNKLKLASCPTGPKSKIARDDSFYDFMVCFTDLPLYLSSQHCNKFGKFGISFKKTNMIHYGAHPVFYYMPGMAKSIKTYENYVLNEFRKLQQFGYCQEMDSINLDLYNYTRKLMSYFQAYDYDEAISSNHPNYYQREWRIVFNCGSYNDRTNHSTDIIYLSNDESCAYLNYQYTDIESLIVPKFYVEKCKNIIKEKIDVDIHAYEDVVVD